MNEIIEKVSQTLIRAASVFREDQKIAYGNAIDAEKNKNAKWVLSQILDNALVAEKRCSPLCDDTGIPHLFLEVGPQKEVSGTLMKDIHLGIEKGLRALPGRPMAINGNDCQRIDQSGGLNPDPGALLPAPILIKPIDDNLLRLTVLMLGGGPAIRGITYRVFHKHSVSTVIDEIVERSNEAVAKLGCSPCTLAIGIGRSQFEATSLMLEAMVYGNYGEQNALEKEITDKVNKCHVGALGLGGTTSVLTTFMKVGPQRASGVRIVCIRPCCCIEPRRASIEL